MDKYFTPDIEDIRVGYECEFTGWSEKDYPFKVDQSNISTVLRDIKTIGVPYLTKEQIESEEWKHKRLNLFIKEKKDIKYSLYLLEGEKVMISRESPNFHILYTGECPSINEFRYITNKLLKIQ